jgi:hypothetical protein
MNGGVRALICDSVRWLAFGWRWLAYGWRMVLGVWCWCLMLVLQWDQVVEIRGFCKGWQWIILNNQTTDNY